MILDICSAYPIGHGDSETQGRKKRGGSAEAFEGVWKWLWRRERRKRATAWKERIVERIWLRREVADCNRESLDRWREMLESDRLGKKLSQRWEAR